MRKKKQPKTLVLLYIMQRTSQYSALTLNISPVQDLLATGFLFTGGIFIC
jgi:hypothetical protein